MIRPLMIFVLSWFITMSIVICGAGCTKDEQKEKVNKKGTQITDPKLEQPQIHPDETASPVKTPEIDSERTVNKIAEANPGPEDKAPSEEFVLISKLWEKHTKGAPILTHEKHIKIHKIKCKECHHVYEEGKNIWKEGMPVDKCEKCHNEPTIKGEKKLPPEAQKKNLKLAFHENCKRCHKGLKKENPETTAPVTCKQCHPKR